MNILAIDTSSDYLSIAILKEGKILAKYHRKSAMRHSIKLIPTIDKLLKKVRMKLKDIDCFAVSIGPGSFTGLRIGVTAVKGLAHSLKKPVVAVPTLDVIAWNSKGFKGIICPVLDARKNKVYACLYRSEGKALKRISKYLLLPMEELMKKINKFDKILFLGDIIGKMKNWHPRAEVLARLGAENFRKKQFVSPEKLEPLYLYSKECDVTGR